MAELTKAKIDELCRRLDELTPRVRKEACDPNCELDNLASELADKADEAATLIRRLKRELDEAQEERDIWRSVFPDIAPESVVPNRSLLEARVTTAEAEAERLRAALEPFASFAEYMDGNWPRGSWMQVEWPGNKYDYQYNSDGSTIPDDFIVIQAVREFVAANQQTLIFMEHFRRARAALKGKTDGK